MTKEEVIFRISASGIIPVIRAASANEARRAIDAIYEGGIDTIEVTLTVPDAVDLIETLCSSVPEVLIGAGTVLTPEDAGRCIDAGARFIISPSTNFDVIRICNERQTVVMPGALTPTEVVSAVDSGADVVKVFPVGAVGGARYIRSLRAPLPNIRFVPTGGVTIETAPEFITAGALAVGLGSDLVDLEAIRGGRAYEVTANAKRAKGLVAEARRT
ncbi:MAG: 2-dehydro-3-deoxyphosphogluconate aldolase [Acidobacteria bacterium OLB17]|nr:MAG: 2-dehydro-3-deoxyphosphogluconate aldolase [Acidobacteria bacterium OLB17]MCZ2392159.1 bifunctional 4-hydroxy-2-oxoglutarate aldolase/2-dehydro-3-deoxy-phosphogluconate aldolase [Acidobacteriota bacterium]